MRVRLTGSAAAVALAVSAALATPSMAQDPTPSPTATVSPSPTPSPTPTPEEQARAERDARDRKAKSVRSIYRDFERDGRIDDCDHTEAALKRARRSIAESYQEEFPDFRDALTAAIERHRSGKCEEQEEQLQERNGDPTPTPTPAATSTPTPTPRDTEPTPAPAPAPAPSPPSSAPESGTLPDFGAGGGTGSGDGGSGGKPDGDSGTVDPLVPQPGESAIPEGTPSPTPAPAATPVPPPKLIVTRAAASPDMFVPGTLLAVALVGLLIAALSALAGKRSGRFAAVGHAWREAAWRTSGTWSDFTDWLRSNR